MHNFMLVKLIQSEIRRRTMIKLLPLQGEDREQFIIDNQKAFKFGALEEFGTRDEHFEEGEEIISRKTIENSIDDGIALRIWQNDKIVGGAVVKIEGKRGNLELLFISPDVHSKGLGYDAWRGIEKMFPEVTVWETCTPYFETRNIHFYVNKCGFHIVEFYNQKHPDPHDSEAGEKNTFSEDTTDGMFRFEKRVR